MPSFRLAAYGLATVSFLSYGSQEMSMRSTFVLVSRIRMEARTAFEGLPITVAISSAVVGRFSQNKLSFGSVAYMVSFFGSASSIRAILNRESTSSNPTTEKEESYVSVNAG